MDYVGLKINNWIVKSIEKRNINNRIRMYLICECTFCKKIRIIRADKRNSLTRCKCQNTDIEIINKKIREKRINIEWEKIKNSDICKNKQEFIEKFYKNNDGKFYKKNNSKPFSKENYIFGSYNDVKEYYRQKKEEKEIKRKKVVEYLNGLKLNGYKKKCPFCGAVSSYINSCPVCKMSYNKDNTNSIYEKNSKISIEEENNQYTEIYNHFSLLDNGEKIYIPIGDIKAVYFKTPISIARVGITRIDELDYKKQGVVGDFQGIGSDGRTFIIDNVFQCYGNSPFVYKNGKKLDCEKIHSFISSNIYSYVVLRKNSISEGFEISLYKNERLVKSIYDVAELWGSGDNKAYFKKIDGKNYYIDIETSESFFFDYQNRYKNLIAFNAKKIIDREEEMIIYFNRRYFKNSQILYEILNNHPKTKLIKNEFENDNTSNYKAIIDMSDYKTIDLVSVLLNKKSDSLTYFGNSFCIYGYPLFRILKNSIIREKKKILDLVNPNVKKEIEYIINCMKPSTTNINQYNKIYNLLKMKYNCNDIELIKIMMLKYGVAEIFNINYYALQMRLENINKQYIKERIDFIYDNIPVENKKVWKSEYELFSMIKFYYPDAIYQYTDNRFHNLRLDIFIPSLNIAFEYQGEQHYKDMIYFTDTLLEERQANDNLKKEICNKNNIKLIEWRFDELITKLVLDEKLKLAGVDNSND